MGNMPTSTYYKKLLGNSFSPLEQQAIAKHMEKPVGVLFPDGAGQAAQPGGATFREHCRQTRGEYSLFRDQLRGMLGISLSTFYLKLQKGTFTHPEKEKIAGCLGKPLAELFPENGQDGSPMQLLPQGAP